LKGADKRSLAGVVTMARFCYMDFYSNSQCAIKNLKNINKNFCKYTNFNNMQKIKIALLSGGISGEREVSLKTGDQIFNALDKDKYDISRYDPKNDLQKLFNDAINKKIDIVFPALHGPFGEDGKLQGMLDMIGTPYVFSACMASAVAMNKNICKIIAKNSGLLTADSEQITKDNYNLEQIITRLGLPLVIKPVELGSSVGISIAKTKADLEEGINTAFEHDKEIMLEKHIKGRELTVAVFEANRVIKILPTIEIIPKMSDWFDFKAKYEVGGSEEICPAQIPLEISKKVQNFSEIIFKAIKCKDLARADFIWEKNTGNIYFLEINTIPGMTATSLAPQAAKVAGYEFPDFLDILIKNNL
jgi:D-alanine-D-alanine ligase